MKNYLLSVIRESIPYIKHLRPLAGSVTASILMQQLDYWFARYPSGFYKFLKPAKNHEGYKEGDSWIEELNFSESEFRTAFDQIGIRYGSKNQYQKSLSSGDVFRGKFYCSYHDKIRGITYYFRNHKLVDQALEQLVRKLLPVNEESQFTEMKNPHLRKLTNSISVNEESSFPLNTEITSEITSEISPLTPQGEGEGEESLPAIDKTKLELNPETFASIPSPHQSARCEAELVRDDQISAAPLAVVSTAYISSAASFHQRVSGNLYPWQQPNGQPDPDFALFVGQQFPSGDMHPQMKGRKYILNNQTTEQGLLKLQGDWNDFLEMKNGDFTQGLNTANRKGLETYHHIGRAIASIASVDNSTELTAL